MKHFVIPFAVVALSISGCSKKPPKDVIDRAVRGQHKETTGYKVKNNYTRHFKDETFYVYDIEVDWISHYPGHAAEPDQSELTLGFVKRGKRWDVVDWRD